MLIILLDYEHSLCGPVLSKIWQSLCLMVTLDTSIILKPVVALCVDQAFQRSFISGQGHERFLIKQLFPGVGQKHLVWSTEDTAIPRAVTSHSSWAISMHNLAALNIYWLQAKAASQLRARKAFSTLPMCGSYVGSGSNAKHTSACIYCV